MLQEANEAEGTRRAIDNFSMGQDRPMVDSGFGSMTAKMPRSFNIDVEKIANGFIVRGSSKYNSKTYCENTKKMKELMCEFIDESFKDDIVREGESL